MFFVLYWHIVFITIQQISSNEIHYSNERKFKWLFKLFIQNNNNKQILWDSPIYQIGLLTTRIRKLWEEYLRLNSTFIFMSLILIEKCRNQSTLSRLINVHNVWVTMLVCLLSKLKCMSSQATQVHSAILLPLHLAPSGGAFCYYRHFKMQTASLSQMRHSCV